jgi:hypothetical protein
MFRKGLHREFPIFFSSLFFEFLQFCILYSMYRHFLKLPSWLYIQFDQVGRAGSTAFHFGITQELLESAVKHNAPLRQATARALKWVTILLVLLASAFIGFEYYRTIVHLLLPTYATIESLNIAECVLLALVFLWYRFLGLRMSAFVFGITLGMGLTASLDPLIEAWKDSGMGKSLIPDCLQLAAYHGTVLIWLCFALAREKVPAQSGAVPLLEIRESAADMGRIVRL